MTPVAPSWNGKSSFGRLITAAVWLCVLLTATHPISFDGLWWELSKGRELANGSWNPTASLIVGDFRADAHWLSGTLPYLLFTLFGLPSLMWLKLGSVIATTGVLLARASKHGSTKSWLLIGAIVAAALLSARQAWEPAPVFFDTLGLITVYLATEHLSTRRIAARIAFILLLLCFWSNLGPRCVAGLPVVLYNFYRQPQKPAIGLGVAVLILGACCVTPAGWHTLLDSLIITVPQTAEHSDILTMAGWSPWWARPTAAETTAFVGLNCLYLLSIIKHPSARSLFVLIFAHLLAGASSENLPLAAIWIALVATSESMVAADLIAEPERSQSPLRGDTFRTSKKNKTPHASRPDQSTLQKLFGAGLLVFVGYMAIRPWDGCGCGIGWGVDPRLHPEAFAASLADVSLKGSAHCVGLREAGLLCWYAPYGTKPFDTPSTALLSQRLREHVLVTSDLSKGWQPPHRRSDGRWGGWWQVLKERGTTALVVPSENLKLITSLEPTIWKPLSLSAVSLVYGKASDPSCARQIVNNLSMRQFVDRGVWSYQLSSEDSTSTVEFLGSFEQTSATYRSLRLARVFRAMQMHFGALKVLNAIPKRTQDAVRDEFYENQLALGYRERIHCGRSSELRLRSSMLAVPRDITPSGVQVILNWPKVADLPADDHFLQAMLLYAKGELKMAIARLPDDCPEAIYAKALLLLESGQLRMAQSHLQELLTRFSDHRLSAMAQTLSASLVF